MTTPIRFGTDGWRGIIAADFTLANMERIARAYAVRLHQSGDAQRGVVVGYDARFSSDRMARRVSEILAASGAPVILSDSIAPTPSVSGAVVARGAAGGVMVTASHNPAEYNGIKFKALFGGSISADDAARIAACLDRPLPETRAASVVETDIRGAYVERLAASLSAPAGRRLKVVVDPMHGASAGCLSELLRRQGHDVTEIRAERNPLFGGVHPEPIPPHVHRLSEAVRRLGADLGVALDGDGDRVGAADADGAFVDAHRIFSLLTHSLLESGARGRIVKTLSTTTMLDHIAERFDAPLIVTPVGFKSIAAEIQRGGVLAAGEESGGLWTHGYIPERDGARIGALLCGIVADAGVPLRELVRELESHYGAFHYRRRDLTAPLEHRNAIEAAARHARMLGGVPVARVDEMDGIKLIREDGYWALFRFSGTEPLLRLYAEAPSSDDCGRFLNEAGRLVEGAIR